MSGPRQRALPTKVIISHGKIYPLQHTMFISSAFPPDPAARQPLTVTALLSLYACHYLLAVLAILPHTYILRLAFVPVALWQAWYCAVGLDLSAALAKASGLDSVGRLHHKNFGYMVRDLFSKYVFLLHAFCSGGDNRSCTEVPRMGTR